MGMGNTLYTAIFATGKIRNYQLWITVAGCLVFPLTWVAFEFGLPAAATYVIFIIVYYALVFVRLFIAKGLLGVPLWPYIREVVMRTFAVSAVAFVLPLLVVYGLPQGFVRLCVTCAVSLLSTLAGIYFIGLGRDERRKMVGKAWNIVKKRLHKH